MNNNEETKSTKIMKTIVLIVFSLTIILGIASYVLDDNNADSNQKIIKQESPF